MADRVEVEQVNKYRDFYWQPCVTAFIEHKRFYRQLATALTRSIAPQRLLRNAPPYFRNVIEQRPDQSASQANESVIVFSNRRVPGCHRRSLYQFLACSQASFPLFLHCSQSLIPLPAFLSGCF